MDYWGKMSKNDQVTIIGTGLTGATLGYLLKNRNRQVKFFDKAPGIGGRFATRRLQDFKFDHGAEFMSLAQFEKCKNKMTELSELDLAFSQVGFHIPDGERMIAFSGAKAWIQPLLKDQDVTLRERLQSIGHQGAYLELRFESGLKHLTEQVVLTCPIPQSLEILNKSLISYHEDLSKLNYDTCVAGLFHLKAELDMKQIKSQSILRVIDHKANRVNTDFTYTVQMNPEFSKSYYEESDVELLEMIWNEVGRPDFYHRDLKKWRYAQAHHLRSAGSAAVDVMKDGRIILASDALGGGQIEGSFKSAVSAFHALCR